MIQTRRGPCSSNRSGTRPRRNQLHRLFSMNVRARERPESEDGPMHDVLQVLDIAWHNLLDLSVFFFLALFIAAMVDLLYLDVVARRSFKRHGMLGILFTTALGAFSPFCSFTVIPLIRRLLR